MDAQNCHGRRVVIRDNSGDEPNASAAYVVIILIAGSRRQRY